MTTVAYKDGIMAFDSRVTSDYSHIGYMTKGRKTSKFLVSTCGSVEEGEMFMDWIAGGGITADRKLFGLDKDLDNFIGMCVNKSGKVFIYESKLYPFVIDAPFHAIGSGADFAIGAMAAGKSATDAVKIAAKFDLATGGAIRTISWGKK